MGIHWTNILQHKYANVSQFIAKFVISLLYTGLFHFCIQCLLFVMYCEYVSKGEFM